MVDVSFFEIGHAYQFQYPRHNFHRVQSNLETRRIRVTAVRDLWDSPIEPETIDLQPLLRRGRWLITGDDLDKSEERSFYLDSMQDVETLAAELVS